MVRTRSSFFLKPGLDCPSHVTGLLARAKNTVFVLPLARTTSCGLCCGRRNLLFRFFCIDILAQETGTDAGPYIFQ